MLAIIRHVEPDLGLECGGEEIPLALGKDVELESQPHIPRAVTEADIHEGSVIEVACLPGGQRRRQELATG